MMFLRFKYTNKLRIFYITLLAPFLIIMGTLYAYPIIKTILISLTDFNFASPTIQFIGLKNYIQFFESLRSIKVLGNTLVFTGSAVSIELLLGLAFALLLNKIRKVRGTVRVIMILPIMFAPVVVGYQWRWLFSDQHGLFNYVLEKIGIIKEPLAWLNTPGIAMASVIVADIWYSTPFITIILLGALQAVPLEPYESAKIDGANNWQLFRYITLPLIKPGLFAAMLIRLMDAFQVFDLIFILTYGGPGITTEVINTYTYKTAFHHFKLGYSSSISIIALVILVSLSLTLFKTLGKRRY